MISKPGIFDHTATHYPLTELGELGLGLGDGSWDRDIELHGLGTVVAALNPESDHVSEDFTVLETTDGKLASPLVLPFTLNTMRRAIFYRNLPEGTVVSPKIAAAQEADNGRGIWGDSGKIEAYGAGILLTVFLNGLDQGGVPLQTSKAIIREQIEHVLVTECDGRGSYSAISALRFFYRVMKYAKLHTPDSRVAQIRRSARILKDYGLELTDF